MIAETVLRERKAFTLRVVARGALLAFSLAATTVATLSTLSPLAYGQASSSSDIAGRVSDQNGAAIVGASIHLTNNGTGAERVTTSNDNGDWSIPNIPPSNYRVRIEKQGFKASQIASIDVEIGKTANGSVTLSIGEVTETVEVSTLPPQLQTQEATVGQVIDQKQINDLPLNGRNVLQLATFAPGVSPPQTANTGSPAQIGSRNLFITVDGGRGSSTNYVLDGTYVRSVRFNNMSLQPNADTIQEFNLLRSTFSTEYGQGQAVVSMVTKSGSNKFHGTAYEFARNGIFDARNYFTTVTANPIKPDFKRNQFGGTLGMPIVKDKIFLFGGYEGLRTTKPMTLINPYPSQAELNSPANTLPAGTPISRLARVLIPTFPIPQTVVNGTSTYTNTGTFTDNYNQYTLRGDQTFGSKHTLFERYVNFDSAQITPANTGSSTSNPLLGRNAVIGYTWLPTTNIVNEVRLGWNEFYNITLGVLLYPDTNWASATGITNVTSLTSPNQNGRPAAAIVGYTSVGDGGGDQGGHENVYSIGDSVSWVHGKHTFKFGFQGQNRRLWQITDNNSRGSFTFAACSATVCGATQKTNSRTGTFYTALENFYRGYCTSGCNGNAGTSRGHYRDNTYGAFVNDIWQFGHGLTLNLGVRWEYNAPWVEQNGLEGSFDPTANKIRFSKIPAVIPQAYRQYIDFDTTYPRGIVQPQKKGFMPRIGIAYQAKAGTVFRAGFGVYLDNLNTNELQFTRYAAPLYFQQAFTNVFTDAQFPDPTNSSQIPTPFSISAKNGRPYTQEWNASVQQDLGHGVIVELAYTGSNSHKLWKRADQNMFQIAPGSNVTGPRPFPQFGPGMLTSVTNGDSSFNGGSIRVEKRASNGLFVLGSYQWSKNMDNSSGEAAANDSSYWLYPRFDRSYSNFDVRHRASISGGYELPFGKGKSWLHSGVGNILAGGWSLQPAVQLRTGYPFSPSRSGVAVGNNTPGRVNLAPGRTLQSAFVPNPSPFRWFDPSAFVDPGPNLQGNVTRNTLRGPGTVSFDLSGLKNFQITEHVRAQFRAEAYNVINRANFGNPQANISTPSQVGRVTQTSIDNRSIQLAMKVIF